MDDKPDVKTLSNHEAFACYLKGRADALEGKDEPECPASWDEERRDWAYLGYVEADRKIKARS